MKQFKLREQRGGLQALSDFESDDEEGGTLDGAMHGNPLDHFDDSDFEDIDVFEGGDEEQEEWNLCEYLQTKKGSLNPL